MTTQVTIKKTDEANHHDAMVSVVDHMGEEIEEHRLTDGGEVTLYVFDSQTLLICEVEKETEG